MNGIDSYQNGTKETWRGWQWNRIVERLCNNPARSSPAGMRSLLASKTVLYLVGPDDIDRQMAIKRGFRNENLIAVDIDEERIKAVRKAGGFGICGSLQQVILDWPADSPIDVIVADFCHGLNKDALHFHCGLHYSPSVCAATVVSVNMMRGRDAESEAVRKMAAEIGDESPWSDFATHDPCFFQKHRGHLLMMDMDRWRENMLGFEVSKADLERLRNIISHHRQDKSTLGREAMGICCLAGSLFGSREERVSALSAAFYQYMSPTGHVFDSVVFRWAIPSVKEVNDMGERSSAFYKKCRPELPCDSAKALPLSVPRQLRERLESRLSKKARQNKNVRGKISALRAVRTKAENHREQAECN